MPDNPRSLLVAFVMLLFGYNGIRMFYIGLLTLSEDSTAKFNGGVAALSFFSLCTGIAGNAGITSAMNSVAKSFPDRMVRFNYDYSSWDTCV